MYWTMSPGVSFSSRTNKNLTTQPSHLLMERTLWRLGQAKFSFPPASVSTPPRSRQQMGGGETEVEKKHHSHRGPRDVCRCRCRAEWGAAGRPYRLHYTELQLSSPLSSIGVARYDDAKTGRYEVDRWFRCRYGHEVPDRGGVRPAQRATCCWYPPCFVYSSGEHDRYQCHVPSPRVADPTELLHFAVPIGLEATH